MRAIVVGAGPGGAVAALELARAGADVCLAEKQRWPRDKTCGDGISPLGLADLAALGLSVEGAVRLPRAHIGTPRGTAFRGGWPDDTPWGTTLVRRTFDAALVDAAVAAGARFLPATRVSAVEAFDEGVRVTVREGAGSEHVLRADVAIVADGATGGLARALGFAAFRSRLVALRGYVAARTPLPEEYGLFYERLVSPGYGWIFPIDARRANVGVLVDERVLARRGGDLRALFTRWLAESPYARPLFGPSPEPYDVHGGVIPSGRRRRVAGRVFLVGDAAGVADPFTAEGIFQAMRSARFAAAALAHAPDVAAAGTRYERALRIFDRNARVARAMRATFGLAIEPYARHAAKRAAYADHLNTEVFFLKRSFFGFMWGLTRNW